MKMMLNLGAGHKRFDGYIALDKDPKTKPDVCHDIERPSGLPFPDNRFAVVRACHILEHVHTENKVFIMYEIWRVLQHDGLAEIELPTYPYPEAVQDPTHYSLWHRNSFWYFEEGNSYRNLFASRLSAPVPRFRVESESQNGFLLKIKLRAVKR